MTRKIWLYLTALAFVIGTAVYAQQASRGTDFKNATKLCKTLIPITRANTAGTGAWCSMLGYDRAIAIVQSGLMDATAQYAVLQDSTVGVAVANKDSVDIGPDSTTTVLAYNGTGRFVRILLRASGNAADSSWASATILVGGCRRLPCQ